ncbi:unnamed protein product [Miscanthus lutarioriparius]|uniref:DUF6598 domain-containing protein n=1 Tax=Miscanthus lutarioriparius TaxID=422564 RepID=A0A811QDT8_9POAL|nr:unnamed protein product [Miscanthus lutarioriparius]
MEITAAQEQKKRLTVADQAEEEEEEVAEVDDCFGVEASEFRDTWNRRYSGYCGCFQDTNRSRLDAFAHKLKIPNKRFTYKKPHDRASPRTTLQVFPLKIAKLRLGIQWPLQVFGMVAIRDCLHHNRNIIFDRPRDNCQIVTRQKVPSE